MPGLEASTAACAKDKCPCAIFVGGSLMGAPTRAFASATQTGNARSRERERENERRCAKNGMSATPPALAPAVHHRRLLLDRGWRSSNSSREEVQTGGGGGGEDGRRDAALGRVDEREVSPRLIIPM